MKIWKMREKLKNLILVINAYFKNIANEKFKKIL